MIKDTVNTVDEKYFFDQNVFDEDDGPDPEELEEQEPPPPVFSEAELEAAKKKAFQEGLAQASVEERDSREAHLATVLETLSKDMSILFAQEAAREKTYEREVVMLTTSIFEKVFPYYAQDNSFAELSRALEDVIENHSGKKEVLIRANPQYTEGVEKFMAKLQEQNTDIRFTIQSDNSLTGTACALSWMDGGAIHDHDALAEEILSILKDGLAAHSATGHDDKDDQPAEIKAAEAPEAGLENPALEETPDE